MGNTVEVTHVPDEGRHAASLTRETRNHGHVDTPLVVRVTKVHGVGAVGGHRPEDQRSVAAVGDVGWIGRTGDGAFDEHLLGFGVGAQVFVGECDVPDRESTPSPPRLAESGVIHMFTLTEPRVCMDPHIGVKTSGGANPLKSDELTSPRKSAWNQTLEHRQ